MEGSKKVDFRGPEENIKIIKNQHKVNSKKAKIMFMQQIVPNWSKTSSKPVQRSKIDFRGQKRTILEVKKEVQNRSKIGPKVKIHFRGQNRVDSGG